MLKKYWRIEKKYGYNKSLEYSKCPEHFIKYLTENIPLYLNDSIYIMWHEEIVPIFQPPCHWTWAFDINAILSDSTNDECIYCGVVTGRKEKLERLNEISN